MEGPLGYFAYEELEVVERSGARSAETMYDQLVEGDRVRVTAEVMVRGASALGRLGTVTSVWACAYPITRSEVTDFPPDFLILS